MIQEVLLVHHSHTDVGYTHPQPVVMELHRRFIDLALTQIERTADWPDDSRFRWTCEVTGVTLDWWRHASPGARKRFLAAVGAGQLEVAALKWNMTPLMDHAMLLDQFSPLAFFRELGVPIRSAMSSDINGLPWGMVNALLDHGVGGLSMAINEHFGYAPQPRPRAFRWQAPGGREVLAYDGLQYGVAAENLLRIPADLEGARLAVPAFARQLEAQGYPHRSVMIQVTHPILFDNAAPRPQLSDFVRDYNAQNPDIRLRIATLSEFFGRLRAEDPATLPALRGDWTDWWNFGSGSTARETGMLLEGQRALSGALQLEGWPAGPLPQRQPLHLERAREQLALYAEHTWGADRSVFRPHSRETQLQQNLKLVTAHEGLALARMLRRDGLERLAVRAGGVEPHLLAHNPLPFPVRRSLRVPVLNGEISALIASREPHAVQRQDVLFGDLGEEVAPESWHTPLESRWVQLPPLPALGYLSLPLDALAAGTGTLNLSDDGFANGRLQVTFDRGRGGLRSLRLDGQDYLRPHPLGFGRPVLERPASGGRQAIFGPPNWGSSEALHTLWHPGWQAEHHAPPPLASRLTLHGGCAEYTEEYELPSKDRVTQRYRLYPDEPSLELETTVQKSALAEAHALYLCFPLDLTAPGQEGGAVCHFETAGATVQHGAEQLPYSSRHFLTTQRFVRLQDQQRGLSVACPGAPLWQVGGFTFGRLDPASAPVPEATLLAWLCNNYWDTNFQADQSGELRFTFRLLPHPAQDLSASIRSVLPYVNAPQLHLYAERGAAHHDSEQLLEIDADDVLLTALQGGPDRMNLQVLNPGDQPRRVRVRPGVLKPKRAWLAGLSGERGEELSQTAGELEWTVAARAWTALQIELGEN
ncbi:hypothetical protein [Deinococcus sp.]|uniref:glycoside hydrolase family 38 N-terminal domain-containing protein n=1 Tax=Deinococcus sp. TaxID=47478 RepID=UPI003C79E130